MDALLKTIDQFYDQPLLTPNQDYICFEQAFYSTYRDFLSTAGDEYEDSYLKSMALLYLVRLIYNGSISFFYEPHLYNLPYCPPAPPNYIENNFRSKYLHFVDTLKNDGPLKFDRISVYFDSFTKSDQGKFSLKFKYGEAHMESAGNGLLFNFLQKKQTAPVLCDNFYSAKKSKEYITAPDASQKNQIFIRYATNNKKTLSKIQTPHLTYLPYDSRFFINQYTFSENSQEVNNLTIDREIVFPHCHFYLFLLANGINVFTKKINNFYDAKIENKEIEYEIENSLIDCILFFYEHVSFFQKNTLKNIKKEKDKNIIYFLEKPYRKLESDLGSLDIFSSTIESKDDHTSSNDDKKYREYYDYFSWIGCTYSFDDEEEMYKNAALELLNKNNSNMSDTAILKKLWEKMDYPVKDKRTTEGHWVQSIKRKIDELAKKYDLPLLLAKETEKKNKARTQ